MSGLFSPVFLDFAVKSCNRHIETRSTREFVEIANTFPVHKVREKQLLATEDILLTTQDHKDISNVLMETGICL